MCVAPGTGLPNRAEQPIACCWVNLMQPQLITLDNNAGVPLLTAKKLEENKGFLLANTIIRNTTRPEVKYCEKVQVSGGPKIHSTVNFWRCFC
jgi:hypothetical protein